MPCIHKLDHDHGHVARVIQQDPTAAFNRINAGLLSLTCCESPVTQSVDMQIMYILSPQSQLTHCSHSPSRLSHSMQIYAAYIISVNLKHEAEHIQNKMPVYIMFKNFESSS